MTAVMRDWKADSSSIINLEISTSMALEPQTLTQGCPILFLEICFWRSSVTASGVFDQSWNQTLQEDLQEQDWASLL